ncbi:MAG: transcription termination/antitermination protein NusG [Bdellovibrionota bacterium]
MSLFSSREESPQNGEPAWYALQVWSRKEAATFTHLQSLGYECFLPTYKCQRQWSDRVKELEQPLFPGYLFSRFDFQNRRQLVMAPGVVQIVGNGKTPLAVAEAEIERLQIAVGSEVARQPWPFIEVGERVRVIQGSLRGLEGILINFKGSHRVVLSISLLQRSVAVEVDLSWVTAIEKAKRQLAVKEFADKSVRVPVTSY